MGQQILSYLSEGLGRIVAFLPNLVAAILILVIGYILSRLLAALVRRVALRAGFDRFTARHLHTTTARRSSSGILGSTVFWIGLLVTFSLTARALGLVTLSAGLNGILAFIPQLLIAAVLIGVAVAVGNLLAGLVGDVSSPWLGRAAKYAIIALAVFMALAEVGVATSIVTAAFIAIVGTAAVAAAIAFGVGNIPTARDYTRTLVNRSRERRAAERVEQPMPPPPATRPEEPIRTH